MNMFRPKPVGTGLKMEALDIELGPYHIRLYESAGDGVKYIVVKTGRQYHAFGEVEAKAAYDHIMANVPGHSSGTENTVTVWDRLWRMGKQ